MNQIYFLNESVINSDEYYDESAAVAVGSVLSVMAGYITGRIIRKILEKGNFYF